MPSKKTPIPVAKGRAWTMPTVLGLIISVVGALGVIELRPQITVSPMEPVEKSQPFSAPFKIQNTGYFGIWVEQEFCADRHVYAGGWKLENNTFGSPAHIYIDRGDSMTVFCPLFRGPIPKHADIDIFVYYRPWKSFPHTFHKSFRFIGSYTDNWQWLSEPSDLAN
jgi:hypothetical protein